MTSLNKCQCCVQFMFVCIAIQIESATELNTTQSNKQPMIGHKQRPAWLGNKYALKTDSRWSKIDETIQLKVVRFLLGFIAIVGYLLISPHFLTSYRFNYLFGQRSPRYEKLHFLHLRFVSNSLGHFLTFLATNNLKSSHPRLFIAMLYAGVHDL